MTVTATLAVVLRASVTVIEHVPAFCGVTVNWLFVTVLALATGVLPLHADASTVNGAVPAVIVTVWLSDEPEPLKVNDE